MKLPSTLILAEDIPTPNFLDFTQKPLYAGLAKSPWHVALANIMLHWGVREACILIVFYRWPTPDALSQCDVDSLMRLVHLHRAQARRLQQLAVKWTGVYDDVRELPCVTESVALCIMEYCYGSGPTAGTDRPHVGHNSPELP